MLLTSCGKKNKGKEETAPQAQSENSVGAQAEAPSEEGTQSETQSKSGEGKAEEAAVGEWVYFCTLFHSEDDDGEYDSCTMSSDEEAPESAVIIRKDGENYLVDYKFDTYETTEKIIGANLELKEGAAYRDAENTKWYFEMLDPFDDEEENGFTPHRFALNEKGILIVSREHPRDNSEEYPFYSTDVNMYMRKGSPELNNPKELAYFDTVTVSSADELLNSIRNNRKIIVKEGKYNFSEVKYDKLNNRYVKQEYGTYEINGVNNLCIEAEADADVEFLINVAYDPVLKFVSGRNITLRGITAGHNVEPGYCSGSVLYYNDVNGVDIENCHLYGSGTYGVEADYTYNINVTDTEIYECTYGLISFRNTGMANFKNCVMRDSSELSMISVYDSYDTVFENCEFKNNRAAAESSYFVEMGEYDSVTFKKCSFSNNEFFTFSNREVTMEDCTYDNNYAGFSDLIRSTDPKQALDKDTILDNYEKVKKKQEEIDSKLNSNSLMDQMTLNQTAYEEFDMWDTLLNQVWQYLGANLDEKTMEKLEEEEHKWIKEKETAMKDAGADFEGGSMQPMVEYGAGSAATRKRVETLIEKYIQK